MVQKEFILGEYVFNANSYGDLRKKIEDFFGTNKFTIYRDANRLDEKKFSDTKENNTLIDVIFHIRGGFPNFGYIVQHMIILGITLIITYFTLATLLGTGITYALNEEIRKLGIMSSMMNIEGHPQNFMNELFFFSLAFYLFGTFSSLFVVYTKANNCNIEIPIKDYFIIGIIPFIFYLLTLFFARNKPNVFSNNTYYSAISFIFMLCGYLQINRTESLLNQWMTSKDVKSDLTNILIIFFVCYLILRFILYSDETKISGLTGIFFFTLTVTFAFMATSSTFLDVLLKEISGEDALCPN